MRLLTTALPGVLLLVWPAFVASRKSATVAFVLIAVLLIMAAGRKVWTDLTMPQPVWLAVAGALWGGAGFLFWAVVPEWGARNLLQFAALGLLFWGALASVASLPEEALAGIRARTRFGWPAGYLIGWLGFTGLLLWLAMQDVPTAMEQNDPLRDIVKTAEAAAAGLVLGLWPMLAGMTGRRLLFAGGLAASGLLVFAGTSTAAQVAWLAGAGVYALAVLPGLVRPLTHLVFAGLIAALLAAPWVTRAGLVLLPQTDHTAIASRQIIYGVAEEKIMDRPLTGWGIGGSRHFDQGAAGNPSPERIGRFNKAIYQHPHSFFLQIWLELGAVGAVLAAGGLALIWRSVAGSSTTGRATALATTAVAAVLANVSYGLWQEWWLALVLVMILCHAGTGLRTTARA